MKKSVLSKLTNHLGKLTIACTGLVALNSSFYSSNAYAASFAGQSMLPSANVAYYAVDLSSNKVVASYNANKNMQPASTQKIITAIMAANTWAANDTLDTNVYWNGKDLTLEFTGDPSFGAHSVNYALKNILNQAGVKKINRLIVNVSRYNGHDRPNGWNWANNSMCFSSENTAAMYNSNCFSAILDTKGEVGSNAPLIKPSTNIVHVNTRVTIVNRKDAEACEVNYVNAQGLNFSIDGCAAKDKNGIWMYFAVPDGNLYTAHAVAKQLRNSGFSVGSVLVSDQKIPNLGAKQISTTLGKQLGSIQSQNMAEMLKQMLTHSNNHTAEQLYRNITYARTHQSVNYTLANKVNSAYARSLGIGGRAVDGSGLSYYNVSTAQEMTNAMVKVYRESSKFKTNLLPLFPTQDDGTLKAKEAFKGYNIIGKTGSIFRATNFTGILTTKDGKKIAFTYFINDTTDGDAAVKKFESAFLSYLNNL